MTALRSTCLLLGVLLLSGCEWLGIESPQSIAARKEAEGKAVGSACRHAARALEDCFALNRKADKAAVFAGWREMNDYMREHKIEPVPPQLGAPTASAGQADKPATPEAPAPADGGAAPPGKAAHAKPHES